MTANIKYLGGNTEGLIKVCKKSNIRDNSKRVTNIDTILQG